MAHVAFQADCRFTVGGEMLAIVATETAGPILVSQIIGVRCPIQFLFRVMDLRIQVLHGLDCLLHFCRVLTVIRGVGLFIELLKVANGLFGFSIGLVMGCKYLKTFFLDFRNCRVDDLVLQSVVNRLFRRHKSVRNAIMAIGAVHLARWQVL